VSKFLFKTLQSFAFLYQGRLVGTVAAVVVACSTDRGSEFNIK
jgi:hypothetical protein